MVWLQNSYTALSFNRGPPSQPIEHGMATDPRPSTQGGNPRGATARYGATNACPFTTIDARYVADGFTKLNRPKPPFKENVSVVSKQSDCMNYRYRAERPDPASDIISGLLLILVLLGAFLVWLAVELFE